MDLHQSEGLEGAVVTSQVHKMREETVEGLRFRRVVRHSCCQADREEQQPLLRLISARQVATHSLRKEPGLCHQVSGLVAWNPALPPPPPPKKKANKAPQKKVPKNLQN